MILIGFGIKKVEISRDVRFDKEVLLTSTLSTSISLEIDELRNSSQKKKNSSETDEDEMKEEVRDSDEPDEIQDLTQEISSETDEDEELKNSETIISSKRELRNRSLIKPARLENCVLNAEGMDFSETSSFLILRLGAPTGILRGGSPVFKRFGPLNLLTFSGGRPHPVSRMSLSVFILRNRSPPAMRDSLWPSYTGHCCLDWSDSESSQWLLHDAYYQLCTCNLRLCEDLFGLFMTIASTPVAYSAHESSQWLFHTVYLI